MGEVDRELAIVTLTPTSWDLRTSDSNATRAARYVMRQSIRRCRCWRSLLPESAARLPPDPRLFALSGLRAVAVGVALRIFEAPKTAQLEAQLAADAEPPEGGAARAAR